jgi:single-stranded DNA-binding protein
VGETFQLLGPRPGGAGGHSGSDEEYSERPARRASQGDSGAPGNQGGGFSSGRSAAPQPPLEDDDIPF